MKHFLLKILSQAFLISILALIPALVCGFLHPKRPGWKGEALYKNEVFLSAIQTWGERTLWVDARSEKEYGKNHIPGAILLNEDQWDSLLPELLKVWSPKRMVVVYCDSAQCQSSHKVAERLRQSGLNPVYILKGGWEAWLAQKQ